MLLQLINRPLNAASGGAAPPKKVAPKKKMEYFGDCSPKSVSTNASTLPGLRKSDTQFVYPSEKKSLPSGKILRRGFSDTGAILGKEPDRLFGSFTSVDEFGKEEKNADAKKDAKKKGGISRLTMMQKNVSGMM